MAVDDLWFLTKRGPDGERLRSKRHGRGKRWRVRWVDDAGRTRQQLFDKKTDAERHDANVRADVSRGVYVDPDGGRATLQAYAEAWRANRLHRTSTAEIVERAFRRHVYPILGAHRLAQIRASHIQGWVKDRARVLQPSTLRVVHSHLVSMFNTAVIDRVIGVSPCQGIQLPEIAAEDLYVPSGEQVHKLAAALCGGGGGQGRYQALPLVAAGTGLRQGEIWGLELEHVDFLRRKINVVQQLTVVAGRKPYLAPVKTPASRRSVDLGQVVAEALSRHVAAFPPDEVEIDDETDPRCKTRRKARLIFVNGRGEPIHRASWAHVWVPAVAAAGLPKGFGFHGLRDYYATVLIHGGANVKTVQLALGHTTPTITLNTYVGHWPDAVDSTRVLIDSALGRTAGPALRVAR